MEVNNLPYLSPINEHDIKLVNGDVFTVLKITGFPYETKSYAQLKNLKNIVQICLSSLALALL